MVEECFKLSLYSIFLYWCGNVVVQSIRKNLMFFWRKFIGGKIMHYVAWSVSTRLGWSLFLVELMEFPFVSFSPSPFHSINPFPDRPVQITERNITNCVSKTLNLLPDIPPQILQSLMLVEELCLDYTLCYLLLYLS